jgi:hypothetical protein
MPSERVTEMDLRSRVPEAPVYLSPPRRERTWHGPEQHSDQHFPSQVHSARIQDGGKLDRQQPSRARQDLISP